MNRNIISILDVKDDLHSLLDCAKKLKTGFYNGESLSHILKGQRLTLIFERESVRTHASFEYGIKLLGGMSVFFTGDEIRIGERESVEDAALTLSRYSDIILYRGIKRKNLLGLAEHATVPVINGLDMDEHPTQIIADLFTMTERLGDLKGRKFVFIGDGDDNLTHSYMLGCLLVDMDVTIISPQAYQPNPRYIKMAQEIAAERGRTITITDDIQTGLADADIVATDTWVSYWYQSERDLRLKNLRGFTVTPEVMSYAKPDAYFMHCMPIYYDEEVTHDVAHGPQSIIIDQAENRMWGEMSLMVKLLEQYPSRQH